MKPAPEIFTAACKRFDLQPEITVFVDDLQDNVKGAIACGWQGVWHRDVASTKTDLQRLTGVTL
jgi:HAD superfamily hydrolase (TIGR01509 family)